MLPHGRPRPATRRTPALRRPSSTWRRIMIDPQGAAAPSTPEPPGTDATAVSDQTVMTVDAGPTTTTVVDAPNETSTALAAEESAVVAEETATEETAEES